MNWKSKFLVLLVGLFLLGGAFFSQNASRAQQQIPPKASVTPTPETEEDTEVLKIDTEVVNVLFTAQDKNRRLLTDLKQEDIKLLEDGVPQEITAFGRQVDLPLSLAIMIDTSASQERTLPEEKSAAKSFIESVVRPAKDEVSVISPCCGSRPCANRAVQHQSPAFSTI